MLYNGASVFVWQNGYAAKILIGLLEKSEESGFSSDTSTQPLFFSLHVLEPLKILVFSWGEYSLQDFWLVFFEELLDYMKIYQTEYLLFIFAETNRYIGIILLCREKRTNVHRLLQK